MKLSVLDPLLTLTNIDRVESRRINNNGLPTVSKTRDASAAGRTPRLDPSRSTRSNLGILVSAFALSPKSCALPQSCSSSELRIALRGVVGTFQSRTTYSSWECLVLCSEDYPS